MEPIEVGKLDEIKADTEKIIEGINKIGYIDTSNLINVYKEGVTASSWTDVVNITGSGELYAAMFIRDVGSYAYQENVYGQIIIDGGEPFIFAVPTSGDYSGCGIALKDILIPVGEGLALATDKRCAVINSSPSLELLDQSNVANGYERTNSDKFIFITSKPIKFNQSLLVQGKGSGNNYKHLDVCVSYVLTD